MKTIPARVLFALAMLCLLLMGIYAGVLFWKLPDLPTMVRFAIVPFVITFSMIPISVLGWNETLAEGGPRPENATIYVYRHRSLITRCGRHCGLLPAPSGVGQGREFRAWRR